MSETVEARQKDDVNKAEAHTTIPSVNINSKRNIKQYSSCNVAKNIEFVDTESQLTRAKAFRMYRSNTASG